MWGGGWGRVRLKLDVQGQRGGKNLDVDLGLRFLLIDWLSSGEKKGAVCVCVCRGGGSGGGFV